MNVAERKVLNLLEQRKVTAAEAADLMDAIRDQIEVPSKGRRLASSIAGNGPLNQKLHEEIEKAAALDCPVLVEGEEGTGKMLIARTIHFNSRRADRQILLLDCTSESVEAELFGIEPKRKNEAAKRGLLDAARGGTVVLDMVGELTPELQEKLYAYLQTGQFKRVGGGKTCSADVRIIAASHTALVDRVEAGRFSADLHEALSAFSIHAPALRDRLEDIPAMVSHFVSAQAQSESRIPPGVSDELIAKLEAYDWPENARELHQVVKRAMEGFEGDVLRAEDVQIEAGEAD